MGRYRAIMESRGFTRALQLVFALTTMIVVFGFNQVISVNLNCKPTGNGEPQDKEILVTVSYPFRLGDTPYETCSENTSTSNQAIITYSDYEQAYYAAHTQFFMSSIFLTFLSSAFLLYVYVFQELTAISRFQYFHNLDFITSCVNCFYSLCAASAFSAAAMGLHKNATPLVLTQVLSSDNHKLCNVKSSNGYLLTCTHGRSMDDSDLMVSTCLGWIMFVLSIGMIWFTYKEVKDGK